MGTSSVRSTMVDSNPIFTGPPSMIMSIFPLRSCATCSACVGLGLPEVLALGAAIYPVDASISACAIGSEGIRTATVSMPPVVSYGILSFFRKIMVSGPGQKRSANAQAVCGTSSTISSKAFIFVICTISGLSEGRPLAL